MLLTGATSVARTLRIGPSLTDSATKKPHKQEGQKSEGLTKKQRQNAAKKAKLQTEKAALASQQTAALQRHAREREAIRFTELVQRERLEKRSASPGNLQGNDWTTVPKSKRANDQRASVDTNGRLIWE